MRNEKVYDLIANAKEKATEQADGGVHRAILESTDQGFCTIEVKFDQHDMPVDYCFLEVSPSFERQTGIEKAAGRWMRDIAPDQDQFWFDTYGRVARTGEAEQFENYSTPLDRWWSVYAFRIDGAARIAVLFDDITDRKRAETALRASEERFRGFVNASADVVYRMSPDWSQMRQLNGQGFVSNTSEPSEDWMERYILPEDRDAVRLAIDQAIRTKSLFDLEHRVIRADGTPGWTKSRATPMFGDCGEIIEWLGTASDVTQARAAREALSQSDQRYRTLFEAIDSGFCIFEMLFDEDGRATDYRFIETNPAFERQSGLVDAVGRRILELAPDLEEHWLMRYGRVALTGESTRVEGEVAPLGRWFDINAFRVGAPEQRRVAVLFTDISEQVLVRREIDDAREAARQDEERQTFVLKLSDAIRLLGDPLEIQSAALRVLGEHLAVNRAFFNEVDEDRDEYVIHRTYSNGVAPRTGHFRLSDLRRTTELAGSGQIVVFDDIGTDPRLSEAERATFATMEVAAGIGVPLIKDGRWVAGLGVHNAAPRQWTTEDIDLIRETAERTWAAVERARAEASLHESEERFRALATVGSATIYRMSPDWREMLELDGAGFVAESDEPTTDWIETYLPVEERRRVAEAIERAVRAKDVFELEHRVFRADGTVGWTLSRAIPLLDDAGEITEWFGVASDVTARVLADQSFTRLFEASPAPFLVLAPDPARFTIIEVNDAYLAATSRTRDELVGRALFDAFPDNPIEPSTNGASRLRASLERVLETRRPDALPDLKYDIARPDGTFEERWWSPVNSPILNEDGEVEAIIHNANDVSEERRSKQHQGLLLAELQHRVRNILSMVRSVARRTADNCEDVDDYVRHLDGRLAALARVQAILTREPGRGVNLHDMVLDELESQAASPARYQIAGPEIELAPKAAEVLSLAVHELATNSTKYGVLSESSGTIRINWAVDDRDERAWLRWTWHEPVGAMSDRPARTGFGTELIRNRVPYELHGTGELRIGDDEVAATIDFPLDNGRCKLGNVESGKDMGQ